MEAEEEAMRKLILILHHPEALEEEETGVDLQLLLQAEQIPVEEEALTGPLTQSTLQDQEDRV